MTWAYSVDYSVSGTEGELSFRKKKSKPLKISSSGTIENWWMLQTHYTHHTYKNNTNAIFDRETEKW